MLLRYVYHEILGNQDVADLPHFRKKNIYSPASITCLRVPLSQEIAPLIQRRVPFFYREMIIWIEKKVPFLRENVSLIVRRVPYL
jgi:hypothetical protein